MLRVATGAIKYDYNVYSVVLVSGKLLTVEDAHGVYNAFTALLKGSRLNVNSFLCDTFILDTFLRFNLLACAGCKLDVL